MKEALMCTKNHSAVVYGYYIRYIHASSLTFCIILYIVRRQHKVIHKRHSTTFYVYIHTEYVLYFSRTHYIRDGDIVI